MNTQHFFTHGKFLLTFLTYDLGQLVVKVKLLMIFLHLQTIDGKNSRSIDQALGQFMIEGIGVKGEVKHDNSTTICVIVADAIVDDKRRKQQAPGVKR